MTPIQCGMLSLRTLTHLALIFGLLAAGSLFLAIATDFWLYTIESLDPVIIPETPELLDRPGNRSASDGKTVGLTAAGDQGLKPGTGGTFAGDPAGPGDPAGHLIAKLHSGLWRSCVFSDDAELEEESGLLPSCTNIVYFGQDPERPEKADTTNSILRAIRKSSPVIVGSLAIMTTALVLSMLGNGSRNSDVRSLLAAILYISSALSLAIGVIFYISAVNDEVSHRRKSMSSPASSADVEGFSYRYGWAFYFVGTAFISSMVASVNNISLYLRRLPRRRKIDAIKDNPSSSSFHHHQQQQQPLHQQHPPEHLSDQRHFVQNVVQPMAEIRHAKITTPV